MPEAKSVPDRWEIDKRNWSGHARRAERGIPRFAKRHDALRAAHMLEEWSRALEGLEFDEAIDDPMVLAEVDAAGRCVAGTVLSVDLENREVKPGNQRATQVPLVEIQAADASTLLEDDAVIWTSEPSVVGVIRSRTEDTAVIAVSGGHKNGTRLPTVGSPAVFAALSRFGGMSPEDPEHVPWTHGGLDDEIAGAGGGEGADDSPDLTAAELLDLPVVGAVAPDAVPGVVL
jgi:hypothetical protein